MGKEMAGATVKKMDVEKVWEAASIQEAMKWKKQFQEDSTYIAGGTLLQLKREQGTSLPSNLIRLDQIPKLNEVTQDDGMIHIGAYVSLAECEVNLIIRKFAPLLSEAVKDVASPAVRNRGSIGGNIAYRIGDTIPALLVLDADISWVIEDQLRTAKLWEYLQQEADPNAVLTTIHIKKQSSKKQMQYYQKVGRRESFIPSLVTVAIFCNWNEWDEVGDVRLAVAGGTTTPVRLKECEAYLSGKQLTEVHIRELVELVLAEFHPTSEPFVTKHYKQQVATNLIASKFMKYLGG
ncbi:FAD binding domain-containing protein [Gracilibacillus lacisalsi]|uniref:FAD binding domain-containing protein n=1 Tax=Gracilibacillus lacisalsi TaxID=393087 RepID=UPI00035C0B25|nr:FAD binding domain-containing protein [Gracilibacillus lacisalsi]